MNDIFLKYISKIGYFKINFKLHFFLSLIFIIIFFFRNNFQIPLNSGDINWPYDDINYLLKTFSIYDYQNTFGAENFRNIISFLPHSIYVLIFGLFFNTYYLLNILILLGLFSSLIFSYLYFNDLKINSLSCSLLSFFWILNPIFIFIYINIYFGTNIFLYLFIFFDLYFYNKILEKKVSFFSVLYFFILLFSPCRFSFNNQTLFLFYLIAINFLFVYKYLYQSNFKTLFTNILTLNIYLVLINLVVFYSAFLLIFDSNSLSQADNSLHMLGSAGADDIFTFKSSVANWFELFAMQGLWISKGVIGQDFYNYYYNIFTNFYIVIIFYIPFIIIVLSYFFFKKQNTLIIVNNKIKISTLILFVLCLFLSNISYQVLEFLNLDITFIIRALRSGFQKSSILVVLGYIMILSTINLNYKVFLISILLFLFINMFFILDGNIFRKDYFQYPGSYFNLPDEYYELTHNHNFNSIGNKYITVPYSNSYNIAIEKDNFSYTGADFKSNLYKPNNIQHGSSLTFFNYANWLLNNKKDPLLIKSFLDYFHISYIFFHKDFHPIYYDNNGIIEVDKYLSIFDEVSINNFYNLYHNPLNDQFDVKAIKSIETFKNSNNGLIQNTLYLSDKNEIKVNIDNIILEDREFDLFNKRYTFKLIKHDSSSHIALSLLRPYSKNFSIKINNTNVDSRFILHNADYFGQNYWLIDLSSLNLQKDKYINIAIEYNDKRFTHIFLLLMLLVIPFIMYLSNLILNRK